MKNAIEFRRKSGLDEHFCLFELEDQQKMSEIIKGRQRETEMRLLEMFHSGPSTWRSTLRRGTLKSHLSRSSLQFAAMKFDINSTNHRIVMNFTLKVEESLMIQV